MPRYFRAFIAVALGQLAADWLTSRLYPSMLDAGWLPYNPAFAVAVAPSLFVALPLAWEATRRGRIYLAGTVAVGALSGVVASVAFVMWPDPIGFWRDLWVNISAGSLFVIFLLVPLSFIGVIGGLIFWLAWITGLKTSSS